MNYYIVFLTLFTAITASSYTRNRLENATAETPTNSATTVTNGSSALLNDITDPLLVSEVETDKTEIKNNNSNNTGHSRVVVFIPKHEEHETTLQKQNVGFYRKLRNFMASFFLLNKAIEHDLLNDSDGEFRDLQMSGIKENVENSVKNAEVAVVDALKENTGDTVETITDNAEAATNHEKKNCSLEFNGESCQNKYKYGRQIVQISSENIEKVEQITLLYSSTDINEEELVASDINNTTLHKENQTNFSIDSTESNNITVCSTNYKNLTEVHFSLEMLPENKDEMESLLIIDDQLVTKSFNDSEKTENLSSQELKENNKYKLEELASTDTIVQFELADYNTTQFLEQDYTNEKVVVSSDQNRSENQTTEIKNTKIKKALKRHANRMFPHKVKSHTRKCNGRGGKCSKSNIKKRNADESATQKFSLEIVASTFPSPILENHTAINQTTLKADTTQHGEKIATSISEEKRVQKSTDNIKLDSILMTDSEQDFLKYRDWLWQHLEAAKNGSLAFNSSQNFIETHHFLLNSGGTEKSATDASEFNSIVFENSSDDADILSTINRVLLRNENLQTKSIQSKDLPLNRHRRIRGVADDWFRNIHVSNITNATLKREVRNDFREINPNIKHNVPEINVSQNEFQKTETSTYRTEINTEEEGEEDIGEQYKRTRDVLFDQEKLENTHNKSTLQMTFETKRGNIEREWNEGGGMTTRPLLLLVTVPSFIGIGIFILVLCFLTRSGGWCCRLFEKPHFSPAPMQKELQEPTASQQPTPYK